MPFELGLDVACRRYGGAAHAAKTLLVLETKPYRYQAALSDIAGCDIKQHGDRPVQIVAAVRDWLNEHGGLTAMGPTGIWSRFIDFSAWSYDQLTNRKFSAKDIKNLGMSERLGLMRSWISDHPPA